MARKYKSVTISITPEQYRAMDEIHWELRTDLAALFRKAIEEYVEKMGKELQLHDIPENSGK